MKPWKCVVFVHNPSYKYGKFDPTERKYIFIRYSKQSKGHIFMSEQDSDMVNEFESQHVIFLGNNLHW